jgi:hypothetical protein
MAQWIKLTARNAEGAYFVNLDNVTHMFAQPNGTRLVFVGSDEQGYIDVTENPTPSSERQKRADAQGAKDRRPGTLPPVFRSG